VLVIFTVYRIAYSDVDAESFYIFNSEGVEHKNESDNKRRLSEKNPGIIHSG